MGNWASRSVNSRHRALARQRRRRQAEVRGAYAERGIDPAKVCGLTRKPCAYAFGCAWNEEQLRRRSPKKTDALKLAAPQKDAPSRFEGLLEEGERG